MSSLMMKVGLTASLATGSLFPQDNLPEAKRVEILSPYLTPRPGQTLTLDQEALRLHSEGDHLGLVGNIIKVSPPAGRCFFVILRAADPEIKICRSRLLEWRLEDLTKDGKLRIYLKTHPDEVATRIEWPTPFRRALIVRAPQHPDSKREIKFLHKCEVTADNRFRRSVALHVVGDAVWTFHFPPTDKLLPQPPPLKNLNVVFDTGIKAGQATEAVDRKTGIDRNFSEKEDRKIWHIPRRGAYGLNVENFQPSGSVAPGMEGYCRYTFTGSDEDPDTGRIECRYGDTYSLVYVPVTCLGQIGPRKAKKKLK